MLRISLYVRRCAIPLLPRMRGFDGPLTANAIPVRSGYHYPSCPHAIAAAIVIQPPSRLIHKSVVSPGYLRSPHHRRCAPLLHRPIATGSLAMTECTPPRLTADLALQGAVHRVAGLGSDNHDAGEAFQPPKQEGRLRVGVAIVGDPQVCPLGQQASPSSMGSFTSCLQRGRNCSDQVFLGFADVLVDDCR